MEAMTVPDRTTQQRSNALEKANTVRGDRSCLKRRIAAMTRNEGLVYVAKLIRDRPPDLASVRVFELISAVRRIGRASARRVLVHAGGAMPIDPWVRLGELSYKRRDAVGSELFRLARQTRQKEDA